MKIKRRDRNNSIVAVYMAFVFLSNLSFLSAFLSVFLLKKGISVSFVSICFLVYQLSKFAFEVPTGFIADRHSRKLSGIIGIIFLLCANIFLFSNHIAILLFAFFLQGLGFTFISGSLESLFVDSVDPNRLVKYNAIERLVFYIALATSAAFGGLAIQRFGEALVIIIDSAIYIITLIVVCQFDEKLFITRNESASKNMSISSIAKCVLSNKTVWLVFLIDFANAFSFVAVEDFYSAFLENLGVSASMIGLVIALQLIFSSLFGFFVPQIATFFSRTKILYVFPPLRALIAIFIYVVGIPTFLIPFVYLLQLILFAIYAPIKYQLFQKIVDPQIRTTAFSLQSLVIALGALVFFGICSVLGNIISLRVILALALMVTTITLIWIAKSLQKQNIQKTLL